MKLERRFITRFALLLGIIALSQAGFAEDTRNQWASGFQEFRNNYNGTWTESDQWRRPNGATFLFRYRETARTWQYVELYDIDRGFYVRLFEDHLEQQSGATWLRLSEGGYWLAGMYQEGSRKLWALDNREWRDVGNGNWIERDRRPARGSSQFRYREVARTRDYVELFDIDRGFPIRLQDGYLSQLDRGRWTLRLFEGGRWYR